MSEEKKEKKIPKDLIRWQNEKFTKEAGKKRRTNY